MLIYVNMVLKLFGYVVQNWRKLIVFYLYYFFSNIVLKLQEYCMEFDRRNGLLHKAHEYSTDKEYVILN